MSDVKAVNESNKSRTIAVWMNRLGPAIGLIAIWCLFAMLKGSVFTTWTNQRLMFLQTAVVATAAIGGTMVIISGGIDLSVGSAIALGTIVVALLLQAGVPPTLAVVFGIGIGFLVGVAIGSMIVGRVAAVAGVLGGAGLGLFLSGKMSMPVAMTIGIACGIPIAFLANKIVGKIELSPFIVTLGMWGALRGASKGLGNNSPVYPAQTWITPLMKPADAGVFHFLPPGVWIMLALAVIVAGLLRCTQFGRHVYAVGSNQETARLCGVNVDRTKVLVYGLASALAAVAAILQFAYIGGIGDPTTAEGYELKVIASVVIGGASLAGGEGSILGTIIGALIMTVVDNGCTKLGLENWVQEIVTGGIILAAVAMDQLRHRRFATS